MTPGAFIVHTNALPFPPAPNATFASVNPVGGGGLGDSGGGGGLSTDPGGGGGGIGPLGNPGVLLVDLLHGDQVVQSGQTLVPQATAADDGWRVRLHLAPDTPDHLIYPFGIDLN